MSMHRWCCAALISCLGIVACGDDAPVDAVAPARPALTVEVVTPRAESWPGVLAASGAVAPWQEASIGAELSGVRLEEVLVNVGDHVTRGQLLARFSEDFLKAELAQLDAALAEAQASLDKARLDAESADRLGPSGMLSQQEVRSVRTQAAIAESRVASVQAQRDAQALRLRHARVLAPDGGVISARSATVGAVTMPGSELFRLIRASRLEWRAEVRADALAQLRKGMPVNLRLPQGGNLTGSVRQLAPTVNPETLSGIVYVDLPAHPSLAAGLFLSGEFELSERQVLVLPVSAVVFRTGSQSVITVGNDQRVHEVKVETGRRRGKDVEILGGLEASARVAVAGGAFLNEGDLVSVTGAAPP